MEHLNRGLWWQMDPAFMDHCIDAAAWLVNVADPFANTYGDILGDAVFGWFNGGEL